MKITAVTTRAFRLPLRERLVSAKLTLTHREMVLTAIETDAGVTGTGWSMTPGVGVLACKTMLDTYMAPLLIGQDPRNHERIAHHLWTDCHYAGAGGLTTLSLAAIDIALWDIKGKLAGEPLHRLLGGARPDVEVYASAINLHLDQDALLAQVEGHLSAGYSTFKMKVGKTVLEDDIERCRAVRGLIGPRRALYLDANQKWRTGEALLACRALSEFRPGFIEEPLLSDDVAGHARLQAGGGIPVAVGEQLCNRFEFWNYVKAEAIEYLQPCPWKLGGITEWMKVAVMAQCANLTVSPHGAIELSRHLAAAIPNSAIIENIFGVSLHDLGATALPLPIRNGRLGLPEEPGHGVVFDGPELDRSEVAGAGAIKREPMTHAGI